MIELSLLSALDRERSKEEDGAATMTIVAFEILLPAIRRLVG